MSGEFFTFTLLLSGTPKFMQQYLFVCNFAKYSPISNFFTDRLSNKPFLIWSLATPPHVKYVATLPCNLSLIACFLTLMFHKVAWQNIHVSQGCVAKYARCAETFKTTLLQIF